MKLGRFERTGVVDPEELPIIIMGESPLGPVSRLLLRYPISIRELIAFHVVGDINSSTDIKVNGVSIVSSSSGASLDDVVALAIALG